MSFQKLSDEKKFIRNKDHYIVFGAPAIEEDEIQEVVDSMKRCWLGTGPKVARFEEDFAAYKGVSHAVAVNSCTAALHLSLLAANLKLGDEVITTPLTFCSTINAIIHAGAVPVLADVDSYTMNIDPNQIISKITPKTRAILPVHFAGRPCDMEAICDIASRYNLRIIEDCAHAIETEYKGQKTGTFGDFGCFSFYVTKNITTGEGGMVLPREKEDAERIRILALHGLSKDAWKRFNDDGYKHYYVEECGFKYNMMDIQAAIGIHQLKRIDNYWKRRKEIWETYNKAFKHLPCIVPKDPEPKTKHAYHLYTPLIEIDKLGKSRDWILNGLNDEKIGAGVHYLPIHLHPFYRKAYGWDIGDFPNAEMIGQRTLSLPLSAALNDEDVEDIIKVFLKLLQK